MIEKCLPPSSQLTTDYNTLKKSEMRAKHPALDVPSDVFRRIKICMEAVRALHRQVARYGDYYAVYTYRNPRHSGGRGLSQLPPPEPKYRSDTDRIEVKLATPKPGEVPTCRTCGHPGQTPRDCPYINCSDVNTSSEAWQVSQVGKLWANLYCLPP